MGGTKFYKNKINSYKLHLETITKIIKDISQLDVKIMNKWKGIQKYFRWVWISLPIIQSEIHHLCNSISIKNKFNKMSVLTEL